MPKARVWYRFHLVVRTWRALNLHLLCVVYAYRLIEHLCVPIEPDGRLGDPPLHFRSGNRSSDRALSSSPQAIQLRP